MPSDESKIKSIIEIFQLLGPDPWTVRTVVVVLWRVLQSVGEAVPEAGGSQVVMTREATSGSYTVSQALSFC